jgi:hypothetical protein
MIPPKNPLTRKTDISNWQFVNHNTFDGQLHDSFSSTTLHLGFTEYVFPVDVGSHGNRDFEVYFQESLVSVHDRGEWIADLDILRTLEEDVTWTVVAGSHWRKPQLSSIGECEHVEHAKSNWMGGKDEPTLTAIDDWNEILDPPGTVAIVRSLDNWLGRLATAAVCKQLGHLVTILPGKLCRACVRDGLSRVSPPPSESLQGRVVLEDTVSHEEPRLLGYTGAAKISINEGDELWSEAQVEVNIMNQRNIFLIC